MSELSSFCFSLTIIALPLVVDVDKYRPQIVQAANEHLNGKLELGKLSLSLWGQVRVEIAGLNLSDASGKSVLGVKDAYFHLPLFPLLTGSPSLVLVMKSPSVTVIKDKAGKINLMALVKPSAPAQPGTPSAAPGAAQPSAPPGATAVALPGIATRARLGLEMQNASVAYADETTGLQSQINDFNVDARERLALARRQPCTSGPISIRRWPRRSRSRVHSISAVRRRRSWPTASSTSSRLSRIWISTSSTSPRPRHFTRPRE